MFSCVPRWPHVGLQQASSRPRRPPNGVSSSQHVCQYQPSGSASLALPPWHHLACHLDGGLSTLEQPWRPWLAGFAACRLVISAWLASAPVHVAHILPDLPQYLLHIFLQCCHCIFLTKGSMLDVAVPRAVCRLLGLSSHSAHAHMQSVCLPGQLT